MYLSTGVDWAPIGDGGICGKDGTDEESDGAELSTCLIINKCTLYLIHLTE